MQSNSRKSFEQQRKSHTNRFCAQNLLNLYLCDSKVNKTRNLKQINGKDLESIKAALKFWHPSKFYNAVCLKDSICIIHEVDHGLNTRS